MPETLGFLTAGSATSAPLTPNLLIQNSKTDAAEEPLDKFEDCKDKYMIRLKFLQQQFESWWSHWYRAVFSSLVPYKRWKQEKRNLVVGDVCVLRYQGRIPPGDYRLCRVTKTFPDEDGLVRTVEIAMVSRDQRRKILPSNTQPLVLTRVAVQRLVLIDAVEDDADADVFLYHKQPYAPLR